MKGSIRIIIGLVLVLSGVSSIELETSMINGLVQSMIGIAIMYWGISSQHKFKSL